MTNNAELYRDVLSRAGEHAQRWLAGVDSRSIKPSLDADAMVARLGGTLPVTGMQPVAVLDQLAEAAEPGLMGIQSGRFFGWVMGGVLPAALGADWLVSAWDQNAGLRYATPAAAAAEEVAGAWLLELLGLPTGADVGFVTGGTMANFTGLCAARHSVLAAAGWDVAQEGLNGAPKVTVLVGEQRHDTIDLALRYLGLGQPMVVPADEQGRISVDALERALADIPVGSPIIVCLQAGNLHSGAFDSFADAIALVHARGGWVHIDGAFGLWAGASAGLRHLVAGYAAADSWATDAHKTLNVPYDCGIAIVADPDAMRAAFGMHTDYLITAENSPGEPHEKVPELSRRARGIPVWAAIKSLGSEGISGLIADLARHADQIAAGVRDIPGAQVLNEVGYTQICVAFGDDERTVQVCERLLAEGVTWMSGSRWLDRQVIRVSVSNWATDDDDVVEAVAALRRAAAN